MQIQYKLSKVYIYNKGVYIPSTFMLVRNLQQEVILGTPFIEQIMPLHKVDRSGISCFIQGQELTFEFIKNPDRRAHV